MALARGEVVLVDFPFSGGTQSKLHPALIVQNDRDYGRLTNTVVAMISSRVLRSQFEASQVFVELRSHGQRTGLRVDSIVNCVNLFTIEQSKVLRTLGTFPPKLMEQVDAALKVAFGLA